MEEFPEVIDLTDSFTYCRAPVNLSCSVIELDDSIDTVPVPCTVLSTEPITIECELENPSPEDELPKVVINKKPNLKKKRQSRNSRTSTSAESERDRSPLKTERERYCPICHDTLGTNPLASTKCGHVYCVQCIEQALKIEKKCPTCRKPLKGANSYHPLFL